MYHLASFWLADDLSEMAKEIFNLEFGRYSYMVSKNERITENLLRDYFRDSGHYDDDSIHIEEQKSVNGNINKLLSAASKTGGNGIGRPEFIVSCSDYPDFIMLVECKAETKLHETSDLSNPQHYAVDGVVHYGSYLKSSYNVICVAVSGQQKNNLNITYRLWPKGDAESKLLVDLRGREIKKFLGFKESIKFAVHDHDVERIKRDELIAFSRELHNYMRDYAKLSETEKPLLVSGILIALKDSYFASGYKSAKQIDLSQLLYRSIQDEIERADIPEAKKKNMVQPYSFIRVHPELSKLPKGSSETPLYRLISDIDQHVKPFIDIYHNFDAIGQFYGEFLRYTGGDKKGLGIVLTPKHITDLFAKLANLNPKSIVLDICAGTGGFLISSMHDMFLKSANEDESKFIQNHGLIGVEQQPNMFALCASNMILRGDGKANLYQGSCFDEAISEKIKGRANVGMVNPPYSQRGDNLHELNFVEHLLDSLEEGGTGIGIAIVPLNCAISPHPLKKKILGKHRLDAVMSMPQELFSPVGTVTCIMVFTAHTPHDQNPHHRTWFGYWKDDGFIKTKHKGRIDAGSWHSIRDNWLNDYFSKAERSELSVLKKVGADDEWCAEAYLDTDYSQILESSFLSELKKYAAFELYRS